MCTIDGREEKRRDQGIQATERAIFYQRAQMLRDMTKKLCDMIETTSDDTSCVCALIIEIRDIASKLDEVSYTRLLEKCMPPKNRCGDCAKYEENCYIKGGRPACECPSIERVVTCDDEACSAFEPRPDFNNRR